MKNEKKYIKIYKDFKKEITDGSFSYMEKLPSKRTTAEKYDVSVICVEHAYELLEEEGYILAKERRGFFVIYKDEDFGVSTSTSSFISPYTTSTKLTTESLNYSNNASSYISDFPFNAYAKTMRKIISEYGEKLLEKSPNKGSKELRIAISNYLRRCRNIHVNYSQIIIGSGSEYLYGLIVEMLGSQNIFGIERPSYKKIYQVYKSKGVRIDHLKLENDGIVSFDLNKTLAKVLHVTPYRSYPTGISASISKKREYLNWAKKNNSYIIEDDFESEFSLLRKSEDTLFSMSKNERVIYLNTFSQTIAPSIRISYMIIPEALTKLYDERVGFYSCNVPVFEQYTLASFINSGQFERHINRVRRKLRNLKKK